MWIIQTETMVLIVPSGIETWVSVCVGKLRIVLIVPSGIETY